MTMIDCRPFLAVGVPFLAAILIAFSRRWPNIRETWSVIASVIMFGIVTSMLPEVLNGNVYEYTMCQLTDTVGCFALLKIRETFPHVEECCIKT